MLVVAQILLSLLIASAIGFVTAWLMRNAAMRRTEAELRRVLTRLEEAETALTERTAMFETALARADELAAAQGGAPPQLEAPSASRAAANAASDRIASLSRQRDEEEQRRRTLEARCEILEQERDELVASSNAANDRAVALAQQRDEEEKRRRTLEARCEILEKERAVLEAANAELEEKAQAQPLASTASTGVPLDADVLTLRTRLAEVEQAHHDARYRTMVLEEALEAIRVDLRTAARERLDLERIIRSRERELDELRQQAAPPPVEHELEGAAGRTDH